MKTSIFTKILALLVISGTALSCSQNQYAQSSEYDDMYFTASDRTVVLPAENTIVVKQDDKKYQYEEDSYSARTVNPDYVSKYNAEEIETENNEAGDEEYFVEGYNAYDDYTRSRGSMNNYFNTRNNRFVNMNYHDPYMNNFYNPYGFNDFRGLSWRERRFQNRFSNRWWRPGLSLSWGNPYSRFGRYNGYSSYYDPFFNDPFCPTFSSNYYGGFGWNRPYGFSNGNFNRFSNRYYSWNGNSENRSGRNLVRGGRIGRSNIANNSSRSNSSIIKSAKGSANRSATTVRSGRNSVTPRSSSTRSRSAVRTTENELNRTRSSAVRRSSSSTNSRRVTPTTRTRRTYDSNRAAPVKRSYSSEGRNSRGYSPTRGSSSTPSRRSYSVPSRSRSTSPSRSSGSSYRSKSSSRSSSPSRSYSSGSSSRSSSSSSSRSSSSSSRSSRSKR